MEKNLKIKINRRIDKLLIYPGCDEKTLSMRKTLWGCTLIGFLYIASVIPVKLIFQPQALVTIYYCYYLVIVLFLAVVILPKLKSYFNLYFTINTLFEMLVTFYVIIKQGGISTSYSYLFVNLSFVLLTIPLKNLRITGGFFLLFTVLTLVVAMIGPSMMAAPDKLLTPEWNTMVSLFNIFVMSALALYFVSTFMKKQQELEQLEANKQRELNEAKTRLFTNVTHEFRTPLTVIGGMADLIKQKPHLWIQDGTEKIKDNSNLMLRLVNQLLDISKIEAKAMPVHKIKGDISRYISFITELHRSAAIEKSISLNFTPDKKPVVMDFDPDIISQILSNLLGNAIKFTPENGKVEITIDIDETKELFTLLVTDSGKGIPKDKIQYVFDRFYQVENHANSGGGTGLGLALSKELAMLIDGDITVESQPGKGSTFTLQLPVTRNAESGEYVLKSWYKKEALPASGHKTTVINPKEKKKTDLPILLIVEDSKDVSLYLSAILCDEYQIYLANNGKTGLEKALEMIPDIIISDIMMPEMDGIEMLDKLKNDFHTSHIPIVMLTAKADIDSRLSGLERGADAYITKPFNETELHIQLNNLIDLRKKLQERYSSINHFPVSLDPDFKKEDAFVGKVRYIMEKNLENDEFNINNLCQELAVSHTQLYRKFKSISNLTVADYLKLLRLNKAKELLSSSEMNITQIAFTVGFKSLSYFSREFAHMFGKSPKEMQKITNPNQLQTYRN